MALAEEIQEQPGSTGVIFFAADRPIDRQILGGIERSANPAFQCVYLPGSAYGGRPAREKFLSLFHMIRAVVSAWWRIRNCQSLVAFGGFASVAAALAARCRGIPIYIHEQNAVPGRANRLIARFAAKIFLTFEEAKPFFRERAGICVPTGCPIRKKILVEREVGGRGRMRMLVIGGSQGSKFFLDFFLGRPEFFAWLMERVDILFLAGPGLADTPAARRLIENARQLRGSFTLLPFLERMGPAVRSADIVLSRSGASFLAELVSVGKSRTILVPYPKALDGHQNANSLAVAGGRHSLAEIHVVQETEAAKLEELLHTFVISGPAPAPAAFSDRHAGAACRILEEMAKT